MAARAFSHPASIHHVTDFAHFLPISAATSRAVKTVGRRSILQRMRFVFTTIAVRVRRSCRAQ
jgi:hypothetical protein